MENQKPRKQSKLYNRVSTKGLSKQPDVQAHVPAMRALWHGYVQSCLRRGIENLISIDEFARFTQQECNYCGTPPTNVTKFKCRPITYNSIDRVDNRKPYIIGNIVPCCGTCNAMKSKLSEAEFLAHVQRIAAHQVPRGGLTDPGRGMCNRAPSGQISRPGAFWTPVEQAQPSDSGHSNQAELGAVGMERAEEDRSEVDLDHNIRDRLEPDRLASECRRDPDDLTAPTEMVPAHKPTQLVILGVL
jgi:hypothetical protein